MLWRRFELVVTRENADAEIVLRERDGRPDHANNPAALRLAMVWSRKRETHSESQPGDRLRSAISLPRGVVRHVTLSRPRALALNKYGVSPC